MTTEQNTLDKITDWATDKYTSAAPSLMGGSMAGASASSAAPAPGNTGLLAAAAPAPSNVNVADWYRTTLGRDADAAGLSFWQQAVDSGRNAEDVYKDFQGAAQTNNEHTYASDWSTANNYSGARSADSSTVVDDWGRNVLGRELSAAEKAEWNAKFNQASTSGGVEGSHQAYQEFLDSYGGQVKKQLDFAGASQINAGLPQAPAQIAAAQLARRTIDKETETVAGHIRSLLAEDSPVLQQARAEGMRTGFDRGLGNSSIAASAGADALIRAATGIGTTDSGYYNKASDYNVAAENQMTMWNAEQQNQFALAQMQMGSDNAGRAQQMTIAQMGDATTRWSAEQQNANSRYNTDLAYKRDVDNQKLGVANSIIGNMELSPDRKAAMLEELGLGTMAKPGVPGTGLAGAVFVLDAIGAELAQAAAINQAADLDQNRYTG